MKCYMDALKKCLTSDAVHSIMPSRIVWSVKAKVRAISRSNMAQPQKHYRVYNWADSDRHTVWQLLNDFPGQVYADYYELWFHFLRLSVTNCADPDPRLVICNVASLDEAVLSLRFEQSNLPPAGCNTPMDDDSDTAHIDMFRCSATSGRRQIPTSKGILNLDDPTYKTLPKPLQALARFAAVCNYLTANGNKGELWWKIGMAANGESQLEVDVMYGLSIQSSASTKRLLSSTRVSSHAVRFFPNTALCVKFDTTTEESKNRLEAICDRDSYCMNLLALQSWAVSHALVTFAAAAFKDDYKETHLKYGIMKGALTVTEKPYLVVHNEEASCGLKEQVVESCRTGGADYFQWIKSLGTVEVCSRQVEEDDDVYPVSAELCDSVARGWVQIGPKGITEPPSVDQRTRFPSALKCPKRVATDLQDIGLMTQKVTSQRIMDVVDKIVGLSSGDKMFVATRLTMISLADRVCFNGYATLTASEAVDLAQTDHEGTLTLFKRCCDYVNSR
jgi:hypothetical protein